MSTGEGAPCGMTGFLDSDCATALGETVRAGDDPFPEGAAVGFTTPTATMLRIVAVVHPGGLPRRVAEGRHGGAEAHPTDSDAGEVEFSRLFDPGRFL